jgi:hypothetical protein
VQARAAICACYGQLSRGIAPDRPDGGVSHHGTVLHPNEINDLTALDSLFVKEMAGLTP